MNIENMRTLVRTLKNNTLPVKFNMGDYFRHNTFEVISTRSMMNAVEKHPCGTVACLAGYAVILGVQSGDVSRTTRGINHHNIAKEWLGLSENDAFDLFYGYWGKKKERLGYVPLMDLTKTQALTELRRLINIQVKKDKRAKR